MSFGRQASALIIHITESTVQVLLWQARHLSLLGELSNQEESLPAYAQLLQAHPQLTVILLADLIDESFRHDTIIHVTGRDRVALIKRKLEFAFRGTPYRLGKVTGRLDSGRRDDRLLLSALTRPDVIDPWINVLVAQERAVQSLTSVAFLLQHYLELEKLSSEEYLLISNLEGNNNLRQSFFSKGQLQFSRLTTISGRGDTRLNHDIYLETLQVRQYLERIQFIPFEARLRIQLFCSDDEATLQLEARSNELNHFEVVNAAARLQALNTDLPAQSGGPALYQLARILSASSPENIYAPPAITRYHSLRTLAARISWSAAAIVLLGLGLQIPALQSVLDQRQQQAALISRTLPLRREYDTRRAAFPQADITPAEMQLVVQSFERLDTQNYSPGQALNLAADALAQTTGLQLSALSWRMEPAPFVPYVDSMGNRVTAPPTRPGFATADALLTAQLDQRTLIKLVINGEAYSPDSFREAQDQVMAYVDALEQYPGVSVFAARLPTTVRTDVDVSTTVTDGEVRAAFSLEVSIDPGQTTSAAVAGARP